MTDNQPQFATLEELLDALSDPELDAAQALALHASAQVTRPNTDPDQQDEQDALVTMRLRYDNLLAAGRVATNVQVAFEQQWTGQVRDVERALDLDYRTFEEFQRARERGADFQTLKSIKAGMDKKDPDRDEASRILVQMNLDRSQARTKNWKGGPF